MALLDNLRRAIGFAILYGVIANWIKDWRPSRALAVLERSR